MSSMLTDDDEKKIVAIVDRVRTKHMDGSTITGTKLSALATELTGRLNDAGYEVTVDVSPMLRGLPPTVAIEGRQEDQKDIERKMWDIAKRLERKTEDPQIEGRI